MNKQAADARGTLDGIHEHLEYLRLLGVDEIAFPSRQELMDLVVGEVADCTRCQLGQSRTNPVPGEGNLHAEIMFVGEGPGADEDRCGRPFVGKAGELLTKMIEAMGFTRDLVYIGNIVKCRPPGNRNPEAAEMDACIGYLKRQIEIIKPGVIVTMGNVPTKALLGTKEGITKIRGSWQEYQGIPVMPTFHPSYLIRQDGDRQKEAKRHAWEDLKMVLARLGRSVPQRR